MADQLETCAAGPDAAKDPDGPGPGLLLKGDSGDNQIWGTDARDIIFGNAGDDVIKGLGGNDTLCGGLGNDGLNGGPGDDVLEGEDGRDLLVGASDNDLLYGGFGIDGVYGGLGSDVLSGGPRFDDSPVPLDDVQADYVSGGANADAITPGIDDEVWEQPEPDLRCPVVPHPTDPEFMIPRIGVFHPDRLQVKSAKEPCIRVEGKVNTFDVAGDGDANFWVGSAPQSLLDVPAGTAVLTLTVTKVLSDPNAGTALALVEGQGLKVEFMPRDFGHFPRPDGGEEIVVTGLSISDVGHDDKPDRPDISEIHPAFEVEYGGVLYHSGKKYAGSPFRMHPQGKRMNTPRNPTDPKDFRNKAGADDWRYCWDENGDPCLDWNGERTFG